MPLTKVSGDVIQVGTGISVGIITSTQLRVGTGVTVDNSGINVTGVITSSNGFRGSLTGNVTVTGGTISGVSTAGITSAYVNSINNGQIGGFRNILHNGSFMISQRGTTTTGMQIDSRGACDRWFQWAATGGQDGVSTWSQESGDSTLFALSGVANHLKVDITTAESSLASNEAYAINHRIEGLNVQNLLWGTSKAKSVTLSFYAKADNATGTYCVSLVNSSASDRSYIQEYTVTSSWQKYVMTFPGDTSVAITNDTAGRLQLYFAMMAGSGRQSSANTWNNSSFFATSNQTNLFSSTANNFYLAAVQLEVGDRATEFEMRSFGQELALCQRYFYRTDADSFSGGGPLCGHGFAVTTTVGLVWVPFPVTLRTAPTSITTTGTAADYSLIISNTSVVCSAVPSIDDTSRYGGRLAFTVASGLTAGTGVAGRLVKTSSPAAFIGFNADI